MQKKESVLEGGIRVPGIVAWSGTIPGDRVVSLPVHGCDWLPTLYSVTGQAAPPNAKPLDGENLMPLLEGKPVDALAGRSLPFQRNRYAPERHVNAAIREGRWKLYWPGDSASMKKDSGRDNPSYLRGLVMPHWEMPLDRQLDAPGAEPQPAPRLYDLENDPAEKQDLAALHPDLVKALSEKHEAWFNEVLPEWEQSHARIIEQDRVYWKDRPAPNPAVLFAEFWQWKAAPKGTDPKNADPLKVFRGYWDNLDVLDGKHPAFE